MKTNTIGIISANYSGGDFGELVQRRTVASIPFGGRYRLIDFSLSNMVNSGIKTVGLMTPFNHRSLLDHVGVGKPWGLSRNVGGMFILPGTIYGERNAASRFPLKDLVKNRRILDRDTADYVIISDSSTVMNINYAPFIENHAKSGRKISFLYKKEGGKENGTYLDIDDYGMVHSIHGCTGISENLFLNTFIADRLFMIDFIENYGALEEMDFIDILRNIVKISINSYEFKGYAGVVNNVEDYMNVSMGLLNKAIFNELFNSERKIYTKVLDEPPTIYKPSSEVKNSLVSAGCIIEGTVENSIIFRNAYIGPDAVVRNSIIMQHVAVMEDSDIDEVIADKYVKIPGHSVIKGGVDGPIIFGKHSGL